MQLSKIHIKHKKSPYNRGFDLKYLKIVNRILKYMLLHYNFKMPL
jgi:hypothetical protein